MAIGWREPRDVQAYTQYQGRRDAWRRAQKAHRKLARAERKAARKARRNRG